MLLASFTSLFRPTLSVGIMAAGLNGFSGFGLGVYIVVSKFFLFNLFQHLHRTFSRISNLDSGIDLTWSTNTFT